MDKGLVTFFFLHHSSLPYIDGSTPAPPVEVENIVTVHEGVSAEPITEDEVRQLQATWGQAIKDISSAYLAGGSSYLTVAGDAAADLYGNKNTEYLQKIMVFLHKKTYV